MSPLWSPAQHSPLRWPALLLLMVNAAIHGYLAPIHLIEAPYIGALFIALSAACIILAGLLTFLDNILVWAATGAMSLLALMAFLASRTIGLPQIRDEIGNWAAPLGYPNMVVELLTVTVALVALRSWRLPALPSQTHSPHG